MYKNQFYYFPALWPDRGDVAVGEADILEILRAIVTHADVHVSQEDASKTALGGLTSLPRSEWAVRILVNHANHLKNTLMLSLCFFIFYTNDAIEGCSQGALSI
jgi:hypothetical protein